MSIYYKGIYSSMLILKDRYHIGYAHHERDEKIGLNKKLIDLSLKLKELNKIKERALFSIVIECQYKLSMVS